MQAVDAWRAVLLVHAAATLFMTGLVWFVQVVHYPLFAHLGDAVLQNYVREHSRLTTYVVAPAMLVETLTAAAIVALDPPAVSFPAAAAGAGLLVLIWLSTALLQVPYHSRIQRSGQLIDVRSLIATNWVRTIAWSLRAVIALAMV